MPFTGSHPAAVLPLARSGLPLSALVIGSMVPDAPYYAPLGLPPSLTHSVLGVVTVDLLIGVVAYLVWHLLLVSPLLAMSPSALVGRVASLGRTGPDRSPRTRVAVPAALAVGALTHVIWDDFTHEGRWGTRHVGFLHERLGPLEGYRWAQYAGGVLGARCSRSRRGGGGTGRSPPPFDIRPCRPPSRR